MAGVYFYGSGHLWETLTRAAHLRGIICSVVSPDQADLMFVADDVLDHAQTRAPEQSLGQALEQRAGPDVPVVVVSQVPPGWTRVRAAGEENVFCQVDTIIVRQAVARAHHPEQFIVGCADPSAPLPLPYQQYFVAHDCPVRQMTYEDAELAKCMINFMLAQQVCVARVGKFAADCLGADWDVVARALHGDARIGQHAYLRPGEINQHLRRDVDTITELTRGLRGDEDHPREQDTRHLLDIYSRLSAIERALHRETATTTSRRK